MVPALREPRIAPLQSLQNRYAVHHNQLRNLGRVIQRHPERHITAAIMTDDGVMIMAQKAHQLYQIAGDGSF